MKHSAVVLLDFDFRTAWFPNAGLSRALLINYKYPTVHATNCVRNIACKI